MGAAAVKATLLAVITHQVPFTREEWHDAYALLLPAVMCERSALEAFFAWLRNEP